MILLNGGYGVTYRTGIPIPVNTALPSSQWACWSQACLCPGAALGACPVSQACATLPPNSNHMQKIMSYLAHNQSRKASEGVQTSACLNKCSKNISEGIFQKNIPTQGLKTDVQALGLGCFAATIIKYNKAGPNHFKV